MDKLTQVIGELDRMKTIKSQVEERCKALQAEALKLMGVHIADNILLGQKRQEVEYEGMQVKAVAKAASRPVYNLDALKESVSPSMFTNVTVRTLDADLWKAKVKEGKIPQDVVSKVVGKALSSPYIQTNSKPLVKVH